MDRPSKRQPISQSDRIRRLPDRKGWFRRHAVYDSDHVDARSGRAHQTITERPCGLLQPKHFIDAALMESYANSSWQGGVGPWCTSSGVDSLGSILYRLVALLASDEQRWRGTSSD